MPRALRLWGVLASICVVVTILLANAFPLSWVALWPAAFSVLPIAVFLYLASLWAVESVGKLILACRRMLAESRRRSEAELGACSPSLNEKLDQLSRELEELKREIEQLRRTAYVNNMARKLTTRTT